MAARPPPSTVRTAPRRSACAREMTVFTIYFGRMRSPEPKPIKQDVKSAGSKEKGRSRVASSWRRAGEACEAMTEFSIIGGGGGRASFLLSQGNHTLTACSTLCNVCRCSYSNDPLNTGMEDQHITDAPEEAPTNGVHRWVSRIAQHEQAMLSTGSIVCCMDMEELLIQSRSEEECLEVNLRHVRKDALQAIADIGHSVEGVASVALRGGRHLRVR